VFGNTPQARLLANGGSQLYDRRWYDQLIANLGVPAVELNKSKAAAMAREGR